MGIAKPKRSQAEFEEFVDSDVPATVVCAFCGYSDCTGCRDETTKSGVVAVIPWERPGAPALTRLWATARATTFDAERFFESMPDGPVGPALRFAVTSEMIAASAMAAFILLPLTVLAPMWMKHVFLEEGSTFVRLAAAGIPGLATLLVAAHAAHGWALDRGARKAGVRGATTRSLRFGLYSAGWDLVIGPLGAVIVAMKEGIRAVGSIATVGMGLPGRSARAFLRGCYRLEGAAAAPALRASYATAIIATAIGTVAVIGGLVALFML